MPELSAVTPQALCLGETMIALNTSPADPAVPDSLPLHVGGAESNVAAVLAHHGVETEWFSRLGDDRFGDSIVAELTSRGVGCSHVPRDTRRPTGLYVKHLGDDGESTRTAYYRSGSAASALSLDDLSAIPRPSHLVHLSGITPALSESAAELMGTLLHRRVLGDSLHSFDVNYRAALWPRERAAVVLRDLASAADIVFVGWDEAQTLWGVNSHEELRSLLPEVPRIVVKDGAVAAWVLRSGGDVSEPTPPVTVAEAIGAGDAFAGGFLSALLRGADDSEALRAGHGVAAHALSGTTDSPRLPTRPQPVLPPA
ncbi:MAG: sugar kinase [Mycetocola sp.]